MEFLVTGHFFMATTFVTIFLFYQASGKNKVVLTVLLAWLLFQTVLGTTDFFNVTDTMPPRFALLVLPPLLLVIAIFLTSRGRAFIDNLDVKTLTVLHAIRIPVEIVLFWLFINKLMPQQMTIEGRNFDILSGLTAPVVYYFAFAKNKLGAKTLLAWNFICLAILLFTVTNAILSAPTPFQQFAFDQPSVAVLYFPFTWLPAIVVPLVYFSHLVCIRRLLRGAKDNSASRSFSLRTAN